MAPLYAVSATNDAVHRAEGTASMRAKVMWPQLDRRALWRCHDDPVRIARLVSKRTTLPLETIVRILRINDAERERWFG